MNDYVREFGSVVGLFVVLGLGFGLAGAVLLTQLDAGTTGSGMMGGLIFLQAVSIMYFVGPALGAVGGVLAGLRSEDTATGAVAGGVGSLVGFYLMFVIGFLVMTTAAGSLGGGGGGGGASLTDNLNVVAAVGVPTALVGAVAGAIAGLRRSSAAAASRTNW